MSDRPRWQVLVEDRGTNSLQDAVPCRTPEDVRMNFAERISDTKFWNHDRAITVVESVNKRWFKVAEWRLGSDEIHVWEVQDVELPLGKTIRQVALETELHLDVEYVSEVTSESDTEREEEEEAETELEGEVQEQKSVIPVPSFFRDYFENELPSMKVEEMGFGRVVVEDTPHEKFERYLRQRRATSSANGSQIEL